MCRSLAAIGGIAQKVHLLAGIDQVAAEQLRVHGDHAPARHVELPEIVPEMLEIALAALVRDRQQRRVRRRILAFAHVVIARDEAAWKPDGVVQAARLGQVAFPARSVQRHVAAVDDEIGPLAQQMRRDAREVPAKNGLSRLRCVSEIWAMQNVMGET